MRWYVTPWLHRVVNEAIAQNLVHAQFGWQWEWAARRPILDDVVAAMPGMAVDVVEAVLPT